MRLLIARHGATRNNAEGRYTGQLDAALSALGEQQAQALSARLASVPLRAIVTSDLLRARATAERIAAGRDLAVRADADLREVSLGAWEGLSPAEAEARDPDAFARWQADPIHCAPPEGETLLDFDARVARALARWTSLPGMAAEETLLWVTHGGVVGVLLCQVLGLDLKQRRRFRRDNASLTEIAFGEGPPLIVRLNDTCHLAGLTSGELAEPSQVL